HTRRNPPLPAARRQLRDCRFARLPAPRARRNDGPGAPPAVPEDLRLRFRHAAKHRVLRHGDARRTGSRPGHFVEGVSPLVWLAMGHAALEGALARQAPALQLLDSGGQVHAMIILFHPRSTKPKNRRLPLSVLYLGAVLEGREEYEIVDGNADPDPLATIDA